MRCPSRCACCPGTRTMSEPQPGAPMAVQGAHRPAVANIRVPAVLAHSHVVPVQHSPAALAQPPPTALAQYPHLQALVQRGRERARCALPRLRGPRSAILAAADAAGVDAAGFEIVDCGPGAAGAAHRAVTMARAGALG